MAEDRVTLDVNVIGTYHTFLAFAELLDAGNNHPESPGQSGLVQSQLITVSSLAAFSRGENVSYPYGASKAAIQHMTQMLAANFAQYSIRANTIAPGMFITEMTEVGYTISMTSRLQY